MFYTDETEIVESYVQKERKELFGLLPPVRIFLVKSCYKVCLVRCVQYQDVEIVAVGGSGCG
jgi:hypothetical protein